METRANYLLIGAFTLAGFIGLAAFLLWFARIELDRQFDYYDVRFPSVSGLSTASEVRFAGITVGQVVDVALDADQSGMVRVRIEVRAGTPVRRSSTATIETLGVTGVAYVGITAGNRGDPLLAEISEDPVPDIPSRPSALQSITENAPDILEELLQVTRDVSALLGPATQDSVATILGNVERSSGNIDRALDDFSRTTDTIATAADDIAAFTTRLEAISERTTQTLATAERTLERVSDFTQRSEATLDTGDAALESARRTFDSASAFVEADLPRLAARAEQTISDLQTEIAALGTEARTTLDTFRETGKMATDRLRDTDATIAAADAAISDLSQAAASVETAAEGFDALVTGDGTALVSELRTLIGEANGVVAAALEVAETDLPAIIEDVRRATATASGAVDRVSEDLSAAAGRVDTISADVADTLDSVTATFETANGTLADLSAALDTGNTALEAATEAFTSADRVLNTDVQTLARDLDDLLARLDEAVASVSEDVPAITGDLRETAARANTVMADIQTTTAQLSPPLRSFARDALPQYARLAREARDLVANLGRLVREIERNPAGSLLGRTEPSFQR